MKAIKILAVAMLVGGLTGCATPLTKEQVVKLNASCAPDKTEQAQIDMKSISLGMSPCAVIKSWGEPFVAFEMDGFVRYNYKYSEGFLKRSDVLLLYFKNDILTKIEVVSLPGFGASTRTGEVTGMVWGEQAL